ncbi:unnamed protein product [Cuscuta campestris]|uniref:Uncharacterized protein n=1 Tax=Cuscuta campestris TaxID=132261 RepID=A0A484L2X6_9ASTE|nr:unnamed protein product [Cuscuta campestris]
MELKRELTKTTPGLAASAYDVGRLESPALGKKPSLVVVEHRHPPPHRAEIEGKHDSSRGGTQSSKATTFFWALTSDSKIPIFFRKFQIRTTDRGVRGSRSSRRRGSRGSFHFRTGYQLPEEENKTMETGKKGFGERKENKEERFSKTKTERVQLPEKKGTKL